MNFCFSGDPPPLTHFFIYKKVAYKKVVLFWSNGVVRGTGGLQFGMGEYTYSQNLRKFIRNILSKQLEKSKYQEC